MRDRSIWAWAFAAIFALGCLIFIPIAGDEAYFVSWGDHWAWGYYDHPPFLGLVSWGLNRLEDLLGTPSHGWAHRLAFVALGLGLLLWYARELPKLAGAAGGAVARPLLLATAMQPAFVYAFTVYNIDTLVGVLALGFFAALERALRAPRPWGRWGWALLAGVFFGLALWTKYTAGPFWIAAILTLAARPEGRRLFGPFVLASLVAAIPFAQNVAWNLDHCMVNFGFNFRYRDLDPIGGGLGAWAVFMLGLLGPMLVFYLIGVAQALRARRPLGYWSRAFGWIVALSLGVVLWRGHFQVNWVITYVPFAVLALAELLDGARAARLLRWQVVHSALLFALVVVPLAAERAGLDPFARFLSPEDRAGLALELDIADLSLPEALRPLAEGKVVAAWYYGAAARFENARYPEVTVFNLAPYGRNVDIFDDFRTFEGRDFIVIGNPPQAEIKQVRPFFDRVELVEVGGNRGPHQVILGHGFRFAAFHAAMIGPVRARYYDAYPLGARACYMDRYDS